MKESISMSNHLNAFNSMYSNLTAQDVSFAGSTKVLFLFIILLDSWETFKTTISNSQPIRGLTKANVTTNLLKEEINCKNIEGARGGGSALTVRGRSTDKGKEKENSRSKSKARLAEP